MSEKVKVFNDVAKVNLEGYVGSLRGSFAMNDMTLACPEGELKANKTILISNCKVIKDVLRFHPSVEQPYVFLADQTMRNMNLMLEFLYTGRANISQSDSGDFFKLAENLQIQGVALEKRVETQTVKVEETIISEVSDTDTTKIKKPNVEDPKRKVKGRLKANHLLQNPILQYFRRDKESKQSKCLQCGKVMSTLVSTNLKCHLLSYHPTQYAEYKANCKKRQDENTLIFLEELQKYSEKEEMQESIDPNKTPIESNKPRKYKKRVTRNPIHNFYKSFDNFCQCLECGKAIKGKVTSNLESHIKSRHPNQYKEVELMYREEVQKNALKEDKEARVSSDISIMSVFEEKPSNAFLLE